MSYYDRTFSSSPVLTMPLQSARQIPFDMPVLSNPNPSSPFGQFGHPNSWNPLPPQQPITFQRPVNLAAGRKRSRDEAAPNLDPPEKLVESPESDESEDEWVFGPGMVLIKKSCNYVADAGSQSGTWVEEQAAKDEASRVEAALLSRDREAQDRPSLRSNKSQRLDMPRSTGLQTRSSPARDLANPAGMSSDSATQPIVDDFTLLLGIGWSRISDDVDIQAAARGWAKYIENHFPVSNAKILLESRGLQSYLVESNDGYFLFAENLRQGRLVSRDADRALQNLKASPPLFDSLDTLDAAATPKPLESTPEPTAPSVEMDMS